MDKELRNGISAHYTIREIGGLIHLHCKYCNLTARIPMTVTRPMLSDALINHALAHPSQLRDNINKRDMPESPPLATQKPKPKRKAQRVKRRKKKGLDKS